MGAANRDGSVSVADLVATGVFAVDSNERLTSSGSQSAVAAVPGSPYQENAARFGNYTDDPNPFGLTGHGAGAYAFAPFIIDETFGRANPGSNVANTTQAGFIYGRWYGPTSDDSAETLSAVAVLVDTGTPFTQTQPLVGFEGIAIAQGGNIASKVIGTIGTASAQNTAQVTNAIAFYVSTLSGAKAVGAVITNFYGIYQETPDVTGTITNKWGAWFRDKVQLEGALIVGTATVGGLPSSSMYVQGASGNAVGDLVVQQGTSQTTPQIVLRTSGGVARLQLFGASGNVLIGNGPTAGSGVGELSMVTTTAPSGTPAANGGWWFVDPADQDAKVITRNIGGTAGVARRIGPSHEQLLMEGLGFKSWAFDPGLGSGGTAPTQGTVYARAMPLRANQVVTNVVFQTTTAAAGTVPTGMFVGIADSTGKMVAQSNNLASSGIWTAATGQVVAPLSATYTVPADGMYYAVLLQVGAFGTTQPAFAKGVNNSAPAGLGTTIFGTGATVAQTALPANNSLIAGGIVVTNGINYFAGAS